MPVKIIHKKSDVAGLKPHESELQYGELAINIKDGKIFLKINNTDGVDEVIEISSIKYINDLEDIDTASSPPSTGQVLQWDGTKWVPADNQGGAQNLPDLNDVTVVEPQDKQIISYNSSNSQWENTDNLDGGSF